VRSRLRLFALVGVLATIVDLGLFLLLIGDGVGLTWWTADVLALASAAVVAYLLNRWITFRGDRSARWVGNPGLFAATAAVAGGLDLLVLGGLDALGLVPAAAKAAATGTSFDALRAIPTCARALRSEIRTHYAARSDTQWRLASTGRDLHAVMPRLSRDLRWTHGMSRKDVALTAQFLSGHYATQAYLQRFGHPVDGSCQWCDDPLDDREHRLLHCPRFELYRQQLRSEIEADTRGTATWEWDFLVGAGRRYLSRFLRFVHGVSVPSTEGEDG